MNFGFVMKEINCDKLKEWMDEGKSFQLIDIREDSELQYGTIEGHIHIRMGELMNSLDKLKKGIPVVLQCRSGSRSGKMCEQIEGLGNNEFDLYNLAGGVLGWRKFDSNIQYYEN